MTQVIKEPRRWVFAKQIIEVVAATLNQACPQMPHQAKADALTLFAGRLKEVGPWDGMGQRLMGPKELVQILKDCALLNDGLKIIRQHENAVVMAQVIMPGVNRKFFE